LSLNFKRNNITWRKIFLVFLTLTFFETRVTLSQHVEECGTTIDKRTINTIRTILSKQISKNSFLDSVVPIQIHLVGYSDSTGILDSTEILTELERVNQYYAAAGMYFTNCNSINYIYSDEYAEFEQITDEIICDIVDFPNVLNLYFVPLLSKDSDGQTLSLCGYTYLTGERNRVLIANQCASNGSTLAHEIGHYFSLLHTHDTTNGIETVARVGCNHLGDGFCDTPADPNLSSLVNASCQYTGMLQDLYGEYYSPDPSNIMSFSRKECRNYFSQQQTQKMRTYFKTYRSYLYCINNGNLITNHNTLDYIIFPNPSSNYLALVSNEGRSTSYDFCIFNSLGIKIQSGNIQNYQHLNISHLKSGTYFVELSSDIESKMKKFIKY